MTDSKTLYVDLTAATMRQTDEAYGLIPNAAIAVEAGRIAWTGPLDDLPGEYEATSRTPLGGRLVTPGLIDCHTHIVHGGDRAGEFEMRLNGASYEEVARAGGGIVSTVTATRAADEAALIASALPRPLPSRVPSRVPSARALPHPAAVFRGVQQLTNAAGQFR